MTDKLLSAEESARLREQVLFYAETPRREWLKLLDHIAALEAKLAEAEKALREATSV